ncbi:MAG: hypothetical protein IPH26_14835 [Sterolibacteriaceae bacterium]|uniref:Uncharacterized protein n=1 Tax=Candidatus Methylophosphatis roskildensis TaxID=2899263 RepID=A0A9D7HUY6_9PROT|nr:hypothetical protein [Candidatus Methylophosphatis roskildensis]
MHRKARRLVLSYFLFTAIPLLAGLAALYAYDPLEVYHRPWGRPETLHSNMRLQAAGVIKHRPFDSVVLGTSMMENTSAKEASALLGGDFVNLSLTAADFFERALVLDDLFRNRKIRQVVYSLDHIYINSRKGYPHYPLPTFDFLYDRNPLNDVRVYLNSHFGRCLLLWSRDPSCVGGEVDLNRPNAWFMQADQSIRFGGLAKWCEAKDNYQIRDAHELIRKAVVDLPVVAQMRMPEAEAGPKVQQAIQYVDDYLIRYVRAHPETRFHLVFPPYFRATYAIWHQARPVHSAIHIAVIRHLALLTDELRNMDVFGFENESFVDDIANYKDLGHYRETFDSRILASIASNEDRLTSDNVEAYIQTATSRAEQFDLRELNAQLDACASAQ